MPTRFGCDNTALFHRVRLGSNNLQIDRARVSTVVERTDIAQQIDITAPVRLILWLSWPLLSAFAVTDVDVMYTREHGRDRFYGVFMRPPYVRGVHIDAKVRRRDSVHRP